MEKKMFAYPKLKKSSCCVILLLAGVFAPLFAQKSIVYQIDIKNEIDKSTQIYLKKGLIEAHEIGAKVVLIHLNTYGGLLEAADSMRTSILYSNLPVCVFIDNNAASAGALLSLACEKIYMRKGASIGAASVVDEQGELLADKYQSYMRSLMRATAEVHGKDAVMQGVDTLYKWKRDPLLAEAMVDGSVVVPGLTNLNRVLTLTAEEALQCGYCDGLAESVPDVITRCLGFAEYELVRFNPTWVDTLMGFLTNPVFQSVLIFLIIAGLYYELQAPGIGFPLLVSVVAGVLYFSPLYLEGLALHWEIALFVLGLVLLALELFVIPGTGVAAVAGFAFVFAGFLLSLLNNFDFDFKHVGASDTLRAFLIVSSGLVFGTMGFLWLSSRIGSKGLLRNFSLQADLTDAVSASRQTSLVGRCAVSVTVLRPSGKVLLEGKLYDAVSESGFINKGVSVSITRFENAQVYVEAFSEG